MENHVVVVAAFAFTYIEKGACVISSSCKQHQYLDQLCKVARLVRYTSLRVTYDLTLDISYWYESQSQREDGKDEIGNSSSISIRREKGEYQNRLQFNPSRYSYSSRQMFCFVGEKIHISPQLLVDRCEKIQLDSSSHFSFTRKRKTTTELTTTMDNSLTGKFFSY